MDSGVFDLETEDVHTTPHSHDELIEMCVHLQAKSLLKNKSFSEYCYQIT